MLDWTDLPRCEDLYLPAEFREGGGGVETLTATNTPDIRFGVLQAGRGFHPGYVALFDAAGRPLCYIPCDPDVCPLDTDKDSAAFFDWDTNTIGHFLFRTRELRTYPRRSFECVDGVSDLQPDGTAVIYLQDLRTPSDERKLESRPGSPAVVHFRCTACSWSTSIPYGGVLPAYATIKFIGCRTCSKVSQVPVDVRSISHPYCPCGS